MHKKILVVDDDSSIVEGIKLILESEQYTVTTSTKAEHIQNTIKECCPDLIILDVMLVGYDGRMIAQKLKSDRKTKNIPIIMISASHDIEESVYKYGADTFLAKPFDMESLLTAVNTQLDKTASVV